MYEDLWSGKSSPMASPPTERHAKQIIQKLHICLLHTLNLTSHKCCNSPWSMSMCPQGRACSWLKTGSGLCAYTAVSWAALKLVIYIYSQRMLEKGLHYGTIFWKCSGENIGLLFHEETPTEIIPLQNNFLATKPQIIRSSEVQHQLFPTCHSQ